jgi:gas vesicle protein
MALKTCSEESANPLERALYAGEGGEHMKRYQQGILLGVVPSVLLALAIALATSEERRRQLRHRLEELRNALPNEDQLKHSAQEAASKAREAGSTLGNQVQASARKLGQRTQEMVSAAQQTATSFGSTVQAKRSDLVNGLRDRG